MNAYKLNLAAKTLTITKAFEDAVAAGDTPEYGLYTKLMAEIPGLTAVRKTHDKPKKYHTRSGEEFNCNQFNHLTYKNMEGFINGLPNNEEYLAAFQFVRNCGALVQTSRYTVVRKWFVAQFPEFRKNPLFYLHNQPEMVDIVPIIQKAEERDQELTQKKEEMAQAAEEKKYA